MGQQVMIVLIVGGLWFVGHETVIGIKKLDHKIAHAFHKKKTPEPAKYHPGSVITADKNAETN